MSTLINCSVVRGGKVLYPWKIVCSTIPGLTVRGFFEDVVLPDMSKSVGEPCEPLEAAYLGNCKEKLDRIDLSLPLDESVGLFGHYLKYLLSEHATCTRNEPHASAFEIMMAAQRQAISKCLPDLRPETNGKDRLHNALVSFLNKRELKWRASDVESCGKSFLKALTDLLWYIDGHHSAFSRQACPIPSVFGAFQGFNRPELHGHRKREHTNMSRVDLCSYTQAVYRCLLSDYWGCGKWIALKAEVEQLVNSVSKYSDSLGEHLKRMKEVHASDTPVRKLSDWVSYCFIDVARSVSSSLHSVDAIIQGYPSYQPLLVNEQSPSDARRRYNFLQELKHGLSIPVVHLTYKAGNNVGDLHYIWHGDHAETSTAVLERSLGVVETLRPNFATFSTRAMRKAMFTKFGRISPVTKPSVLRCYYRELTGDRGAASNATEEEVDRKVKQLLDMEPEDVRTLTDLAEVSTQQKTKFDVFWSECAKFLSEDIGLAVDDRRHDCVTHLAKAISVRDLLEQVQARCPPDCPIPSQEWLRLQFWPKTPRTHAALHYTGRLNVKFMIQQRQFRKEHEDGHYAAALFRYEREYSVRMRDHCNFVCVDDKHRAKVGEPGYPVAAAERGRRVIVARNSTFEVGDHDFTKFSVVPSVALKVDVPEDVSESWYRGDVVITLKDAAFEPSSPMRHSAELVQTLRSDLKPILFLYSDGGPDHRVTYINVQIALIALFRRLDLDYLCAARTAPCHSWRNPVERVMSTLNLGMQCVGLMRGKGSKEFEQEVKKCNSLASLRSAAAKHSNVKEESLDSMAPVKVLLSDVFRRLRLKDREFHVNVAASDAEVEEMWESLSTVDPSLTSSESIRKGNLPSKPQLVQFLDHCCRQRHYFFEIRKCGDRSCTICKAVRLPDEVFSSLRPLPDPMPGADGHYLPFDEAFGKQTSEAHRPSLQTKAKRKKTLPFHGVLQHVKNVNMMLECEECGMWRLLYARRKLKAAQRRDLEHALEDWTFTCGAQLQDLDLPGDLGEVYVREMSCGEPIEKLYYSAKYDPICIYCALPQSFTDPQFYPLCASCQNREKIRKS